MGTCGFSEIHDEQYEAPETYPGRRYTFHSISTMTSNANDTKFSASGTALTRFEWSGAEYSRARKTGDWMITQDADPQPIIPRFLTRKNKPDSNGSTNSTDSAGSTGSTGSIGSSAGRVIISRFPDATVVNVRKFATETQSAFFSKPKKTTPSGRKIQL
jgi:hypothetical protein